MTDREALDKAQKELDTASYIEETSPYEGIKAVHRNRIAWLARVLRLARKALYIEENQKQTKTNADRIRAMSDEELAVWMAECNAYGERADASQWLPWLKQPAEE